MLITRTEFSLEPR